MYVAGMHLGTYDVNSAQTASIFYYDHADWLGTERARTNLSGVACETTTSFAFGDGQAVSSSCGQSVSPRRFTGKERDGESGLDNFDARYYSSSMARFMSPDWAAKPTDVPYANFDNPQSLNLYSYAENNPTTTDDPDGHDGSPLDILIGFAQSLFNNTVVPASGAIHAVDNLTHPDDPRTGTAPLLPQNDVQAGAQTGMNRGLAMAGALFGDEPAVAGSRAEMGAAESASAETATAETTGKATQLQINKATGDAFRDEVAGSLKAAGRDVQTEVTKQTPFGPRRVDIEVSHNGQTLGGVETKTGNSPYKPSQRAKDNYLKQNGYPVNVVRKPKPKEQ
jgi:RHS repeat-associated protein